MLERQYRCGCFEVSVVVDDSAAISGAVDSRLLQIL